MSQSRDSQDNLQGGKAGEPALADRRREFGVRLRQMREEVGMTVTSLAQATRIRQSFIDALENGDFACLPGEVFGRGFVKSICKIAGIEEEQLLEMYNSCWTGQKPSQTLNVPVNDNILADRLKRAERGQKIAGQFKGSFSLRRVATATAGGVVVLLLLALVIVKWSGRDDGAVATPEKVIEPVAEEVVPDSGPQPEADVVDAGVLDEQFEAPDESEPSVPTASLESDAPVAVAVEPEKIDIAAESTVTDQKLEIIVNSPVEIRLQLDEKNRETRQLEPDTYNFTFTNRAELLIFDASAVDILFNGRGLGSLGKKGRVRRISFSSEAPVDRKI